MNHTTKQPSARETAERIAKENVIYLPDRSFVNEALLADAIEGVLLARMEADAELAEQCHEQPCTCQTCLIHAEAAAAIRRAIRKE